jgi:hypothetical protein
LALLANGVFHAGGLVNNTRERLTPRMRAATRFVLVAETLTVFLIDR